MYLFGLAPFVDALTYEKKLLYFYIVDVLELLLFSILYCSLMFCLAVMHCLLLKQKYSVKNWHYI
jgi:hypothetical protein